MKLSHLFVLLALAACNPAQRCKSAGDCGDTASCSGGFCTDLSPTTSSGDGGTGQSDDLDGADAGVVEDAGVDDAGMLDNGRP